MQKDLLRFLDQREKEIFSSYPSLLALLLAVLIPLLSEDISPDSRVLLLRGEASLIDRYLLWVDESCTGGAAYIGELIATQQFVGSGFGATHTIDGGEIAFGGFAVREAYFVIFTDASVNLVHREYIFYFCHLCSAIEHRVKLKQKL